MADSGTSDNLPILKTPKMEDSGTPDNGPMLETPKRRMLNISEKIELIKVIDTSTQKKKDIAAMFGIPVNTLCTIYSHREKFLQQSQSDFTNLNKKRMRSSTYPDIEEELLKWFITNHSSNGTVSGILLREKALQVAKTLGHHDFSASNGWIERFKVRHNLKVKRNKKKKKDPAAYTSNGYSSFIFNKNNTTNSNDPESFTSFESSLVWENVSNPVMELTEVKEEYDVSHSPDCDSHNSILPHQTENNDESSDLHLNTHIMEAGRHRRESGLPFDLANRSPPPNVMETGVNHDFNIPSTYEYAGYNRKYPSMSIQNVEEAYNVIQCYIEGCRGSIKETTVEAMKELKSFITVEKDKRTQSKITDYFSFT